MTLQIPDTFFQKVGMTEGELLLRIAVMLFQEEKLTLAQASQFAGIHQMEFQKELARRKISIHYGEEDLLNDLETIAKINSK